MSRRVMAAFVLLLAAVGWWATMGAANLNQPVCRSGLPLPIPPGSGDVKMCGPDREVVAPLVHLGLALACWLGLAILVLVARRNTRTRRVSA
jgi:hypothetical protein